MPSRTITDAYYASHLAIADEGMEKAGIRLAEVLNIILEGREMDGRIILRHRPWRRRIPRLPQQLEK